MATADPAILHDHALQAEKHLEALATGLAHAGAPEQVTKSIGQMADAMRQIIASMGNARSATPSPDQQPQQPETMDSAANGLVADVRAHNAA